MASYSNSMSVPIILHTLLGGGGNEGEAGGTGNEGGGGGFTVKRQCFSCSESGRLRRNRASCSVVLRGGVGGRDSARCQKDADVVQRGKEERSPVCVVPANWKKNVMS